MKDQLTAETLTRLLEEATEALVLNTTRGVELSKAKEEADERVKALEEALRPFALFAQKWEANPLRGIDDVLYAIHAGEDHGEIRLSDCKRAKELLGDK